MKKTLNITLVLITSCITVNKIEKETPIYNNKTEYKKNYIKKGGFGTKAVIYINSGS